jgi:sugar/nucleoside kinase (ribokinase family)
MAVDVLILNTAVVDLRRPDFDFTDKLVGKGGLAKCRTEDMPDYSQEQVHQWIEQGFATAGGPGNCAPLIGRTGLKVAVAVNLGKGNYDGLDAQGRFFHDVMVTNDIDTSATYVHPSLPTGTTFIHSTAGGERGGIAYFPNANDDFDFEIFKSAVERLQPKIVYYMYSGLSARGDANRGNDLADFIKWCRIKGAVTIADSHTLTGSPQELIKSGRAVKEYKLLEPLLPELDVFFTSSDESKLIENTLLPGRKWTQYCEHENDLHFLDFVTERFWMDRSRTRLFGVTVSNGAYEKHLGPGGKADEAGKIESRFMAGEVIDLVGAGDSFRAGLISYITCNLEAFCNGSMDFAEAVQMGNLFASLYIKAPLGDRYGNIRPFDRMLGIVRSGKAYSTLSALQRALK